MFGLRRAISKVKATSLDALRSNVMVADNQFNIVYINRSLLSLFEEAEDDIRKELPRFSVKSLIGSNIDIFHRNSAHQRAMLTKLNRPHLATIHIGKHSFDLHVTPLLNANRKNGFVVEWMNAADRLLNVDFHSQITAVERSQAIIEFTVDGIIRRANDNFLQAMGYRLDEIVGKHHRLFMDPDESRSPEYAKFWESLARGDFQAGEFKRLGKGGKIIWIRGSYDPIFDANGKVTKVIKYAIDVTERVRAVNGIGAGLKELADKNLRFRLTNDFTTEFEPLRHNFNSSLDCLQTTMVLIAENAQGVSSGAGEITAASDDLARRTEQQAASLEETAAALNQITTTVKKTAEIANDASQVVSRAKADAQHSREVLHKTVAAMNGIETFSKKISSIIGVIDEIAFQTNLLALNAGVEAARAGDAGRGFAVVATEVRALAQRSADAAKEIKALISTTSQQVDIGVKLVGETGDVLVNIAGQVADLNKLVSEIAASAQEQATGLGEVNTAVNQMDHVTQQNAAMVEEATAASHSLTAEAGGLNDLVSQFQIGRVPTVRDTRSNAQKFAPVTTVKPYTPNCIHSKKSKLVMAAANTEDWSEF